MAKYEDVFVADLMSIEPIVVRASESIEHVEAVLRDFGITGVPVVDERGVLVGVFSQTDSLHLGHANIPRLGASPVGDVMSRPAITVNSLASVAEAARVMRDNDVHRVVVADDDGRPIGVLSAMDFVRLAAE